MVTCIHLYSFQTQDEKKLIQNLRKGRQDLSDNDSVASGQKTSLPSLVNKLYLI